MGIGADKSGQGGIIDSPIHMNQVNFLNTFVASVAFIGKRELGKVERVVNALLILPRHIT
ncbi:hypothetical protein AB835_12775 [Candidatus Endobugula sertula]|uniref:Uncharacterized protein n=1 Tax=Candidatus Endobugula sertula TaxID=62101 RepID=A0A1D2QMB1_9GAMM|nr:hypothetical protein AB835_12775 [Candidatus Endobugula sertula]